MLTRRALYRVAVEERGLLALIERESVEAEPHLPRNPTAPSSCTSWEYIGARSIKIATYSILYCQHGLCGINVFCSYS